MRLFITILFFILHICAAYAYDGYGFDDGGSYDPFSDYIAIYSSDDSSMGNMMDSGSYQSYSYGSGTSNSLWIQSSTGQLIQSMQCILFSQVMLIAYSPGGSAIMTEVYPDGQQIQNYYQLPPGYAEMVFAADQPGRHILSYELNGQLSNIVILDVLSSDSGLHIEDSLGAAYPTPFPLSATPMIEDNTAPVLNSLTPDKSSPQIIGNPITWTANAYDSDGDPIYYRFWLAKENNLTGDIWIPMDEWRTENTWTWIPDCEGDYRISVMVRDGHHTNSPDGGDSSMAASFSVIKFLIYGTILPNDQPTANRPPVIDDFSTDRLYAAIGYPKTFTVAASDPDGDQIYYKYWLLGPDADLHPYIYDYSEMTDWTTENSWTWTPKESDVGDFDIMVDVRDGHNSLPNSWDDFSEIRVEVRVQIPYANTLSKGSKKRPRNK